MNITILGSGTAIPVGKRSGPSVLCKAGEKLILIDMGRNSLDNLTKCGYSHRDITHICFTHHHPDHTAELVSLLFALRNPDLPLRQGSLNITGSNMFLDWYESLYQPYGRWIDDLPFELHLRNVIEEKIGIGDLEVSALKMKHIKSSVGYRLEEPAGNSFVVSGDTDYCENIIELSEDADLLILECAHPENKKLKGHLIPSEAGKIASLAGVKKLVLTHFYPECDNSSILPVVRKHFSGEVVLAEDLQKHSI